MKLRYFKLNFLVISYYSHIVDNFQPLGISDYYPKVFGSISDFVLGFFPIPPYVYSVYFICNLSWICHLPGILCFVYFGGDPDILLIIDSESSFIVIVPSVHHISSSFRRHLILVIDLLDLQRGENKIGRENKII